MYLLIPLIVGLALLTYTTYTPICRFPCGLSHPYQLYGAVLIVADLCVYGLLIGSVRAKRKRAMAQKG